MRRDLAFFMALVCSSICGCLVLFYTVKTLVVVSLIGLLIGLLTGFIKTHRFLYLVTVILPFSYIPYEIAHKPVNLTYLVFVMILILGRKYKVYYVKLDKVEFTVLFFMVYMVTRLAVGVYLGGNPTISGWYDIGREGSKLISGIVLYRIAKNAQLAPTIYRGLCTTVFLLVGLEFYQIHEGLNTLLSLGYTTPKFNYNTAAGTMRPFSAFLSPVDFGDYLAVILGFLIWFRFENQSVRLKLFIVCIGIVGLLFTETRSGWISLPIGIGLVAIYLSRSRRKIDLFIRMLVPTVLFVVFFALFTPTTMMHYLNRLFSVFDPKFTSNTDRLALWGGVIHASIKNTVTFVSGYADANFTGVLSNYIPNSIALLGHAHSVYFELLYKYGLIGVGMFISILILMYRGIIKSSTSHAINPSFTCSSLSSLTIYILCALFENFWTGYNFNITLFLLVGIGINVQLSGEIRSNSSSKRDYMLA